MEPTYDWYLIFNYTEFLGSGLVQKTIEPELEGRAKTKILITHGNTVGVQVDDVFLMVSFLDENPYEREGYAVYRHTNDDVYLGFEVEQ